MSNLNHSILKDLLLPVLSIAVQRKPMEKADGFLTETRRLGSIYQQKLAAQETLKTSPAPSLYQYVEMYRLWVGLTKHTQI